jgi:hypothetical protein
MTFANYLQESTNEELTVDEFLAKIKKHGLYGYNVFKNIKEDELRKILEDDEYFEKTMKKAGLDSKEVKDDLTEMVLPPNQNNDKETNNQPKTQQNKLSLAVRLGLKSKENTDDNEDSQEQHKFGQMNNAPKKDDTDEKPSQQSFADRMRAEFERRRQEQIEKANKEREEREAKKAEIEANKDSTAKPEFNGKSMDSQQEQDSKTNDKINDTLDKKLTDAMFKKTRAVTKTDDNGYKKVTNLSRTNDRDAEDRLKQELAKRKEDEEKKSNAKLGNSNTPAKKMTNNEYSKRTLMAIADRMKFDVYCKFRKLNGQVRTGNFQIGKTDQQITQKQNTIIVVDLDLTKKENKTTFRTINLDKIIEIKPI